MPVHFKQTYESLYAIQLETERGFHTFLAETEEERDEEYRAMLARVSKDFLVIVRFNLKGPTTCAQAYQDLSTAGDHIFWYLVDVVVPEDL